MHISEVHAPEFRRFADLTILIPGRPKLVVLCGPNGSGKSSVFDAMRLWQGMRGLGYQGDAEYWGRGGHGIPAAHELTVKFHELDGELANGSDALKKAVYVRTAYRNDPAFAVTGITRAGPLLDTAQATASRMIDNDVRVSMNYQRLVALTVEDVWGGGRDGESVTDLRERYIGDLRDALLAIFPDLELTGLGDPLENGTFRFQKGGVPDFPYMNLSGGEKAAFDLLLDLLTKRTGYDDTVFCIDEPEAHLNTRVQGDVLSAVISLVNDASQLWVATHSLGMLRRAQQMQNGDPESVVFLDFQDRDFDQPQIIQPQNLDREFWQRTLDVALGDVAALVGPARVVFCEGKPVEGNQGRAEFDARCYRRIFADRMPDTDFVSVGNALDVETDKLRLGATITALISGTTVIRVVDRDHRSADEVNDLAAAGVRVLGRRHLEAFLLDEEVIGALCESVGRADLLGQALQVKADSLAASQARGKDPDDIKSAAGDIYVGLRRVLALQQAGNTKDAFLSDTVAPLIQPGMAVYEELRENIFGP